MSSINHQSMSVTEILKVVAVKLLIKFNWGWELMFKRNGYKVIYR